MAASATDNNVKICQKEAGTSGQLGFTEPNRKCDNARFDAVGYSEDQGVRSHAARLWLAMT